MVNEEEFRASIASKNSMGDPAEVPADAKSVLYALH
jgi:hypothetical protein